ncbi:hypothetical protein L6164_033055 [Bauhinia variegata]|uniref:Uncharacterized protein n=1 Tax=Bauhinia variegata TaxID=167791 RepID=A0ACB9KQH4_BAUVA|nr:hypothetical protein L6164_033055 [Bauhinia variegata]
MFLRQVAGNLLKRLGFPSRHAYSASGITNNASRSRKIEISNWHGSGAYSWRIDPRDPRLWVVICGNIAMILGINANPVFAKEASTEASSDNDTERADIIGLRKIEDGSIVSNIHTSKWRVFTDKGREFFLQGKLDEAEKLFLAALEEAKEGFGKRDPHVASACNNLAELYRVKRAFEKAEPLYNEALDILKESYGYEDIRVGTTAHNVGQFFLGQRKLKEARGFYEIALKIKRRALGYVHLDCADTMYHLGVVLYLQGQEMDGMALIQDSIKMLEELGEGESFECVRRLRYLSQIYTKSHNLAEAEMIQRKILHVMELSKGWDSLDTVIAAEALALTLLASCNFKDAQDLLERCLKTRKALLPGDHIQIGANMLHLARLALNSRLLNSSDVSRAEAELDKAKDHLQNSIRIARQFLDKSLKQNNKSKNYSPPRHSGKEGRAALVILVT